MSLVLCSTSTSVATSTASSAATRLGAGGVAAQRVEDKGGEEALDHDVTLTPDTVLNLELEVPSRPFIFSRLKVTTSRTDERTDLKLGLRCMQCRPDDARGVLVGGQGPQATV